MSHSCGCTLNSTCNQCRQPSPPRVTHQRLKIPTPPPIYKRRVNRNPTPEPDVIERTHVRREPRVIIENITEQPSKPPPRVVDRYVVEPAEPPIVRNSCVNVPPRSRGYCSSSVGPRIYYPSQRRSNNGWIRIDDNDWY